LNCEVVVMPFVENAVRTKLVVALFEEVRTTGVTENE
jgi:hypothetical protein